MKYWEAVLHEVLNKDKEGTQFLFTNLGEEKRKLEEEKENTKNTKIKKERKTYPLGKEFGDLYLTQREAECMNLLLQGHTIVSTAKQLGLSGRTVEFYVKNMKLKLSCSTKNELVKMVAKCDFLKVYRKKER